MNSMLNSLGGVGGGGCVIIKFCFCASFA